MVRPPSHLEPDTGPSADPAGPDAGGAFQARLLARDAALAELAVRLDAAERARDDLARRTERQAAEIAQLTARLLGPEPDRAELQVRLAILEAELAAVRADPLWRLGAPLRRLLCRLRRRLAGIFGGGG